MDVSFFYIPPHWTLISWSGYLLGACYTAGTRLRRSGVGRVQQREKVNRSAFPVCASISGRLAVHERKSISAGDIIRYKSISDGGGDERRGCGGTCCFK